MPAKKKSDGGGVGPHVRALRGGRTDFEPAAFVTVAQFLVMLHQRYTDAAARAAGQSNDVNRLIKEGIRKRYKALADAAMVFLSDAACPWSRVQWLKAGEVVAPLADGLATAADLLALVDDESDTDTPSRG